MIRSAIVDREIDVASVIAEVQSTKSGGISLFLGTVRETSDGRSVIALEYEAYRAMAESELAAIVEEAVKQFHIAALVAEHRVGHLAPGDVSVVIASAHEHRAAALDCTRFVIEEIKKRVPIWKREYFADGAREWVDSTQVAASTS